MHGQSLNPAFVSPYSVQRAPFTRPPYHQGNPSLWQQSNSFRPRLSTLPPAHPGPNLSTANPVVTLPSSTNVKSEASAPIDFHNTPFPQQHSSMPGSGNLPDFPTLFENTPITLQQNQQYNDVTLDSLPSLGPEGTSQVLNDSTLPAASASSNMPKLEEAILGDGDVSIDLLFEQRCSIEEGDRSLLSLLQDASAPPNNIFQTPDQVPPVPVVQKQVDPLVTSHHVMSPQMPPQASSVPPQSMLSPNPLSPPNSNPVPNLMTNAMSPHPNLMSPGSEVLSPPQVPNSVAGVNFSQPSPMTTQQPPFYQIPHDPVDFGFPQQGMNPARNTNNSNNFAHGDGREDSFDTFLKKLSK